MTLIHSVSSKHLVFRNFVSKFSPVIDNEVANGFDAIRRKDHGILDDTAGDDDPRLLT